MGSRWVHPFQQLVGTRVEALQFHELELALHETLVVRMEAPRSSYPQARPISIRFRYLHQICEQERQNDSRAWEPFR